MTGTAELSLARWLPDRAALTPDRVAIDFAGKHISYAELAASAAGWAAVFAAAGLGQGDRVATLARNCPEQVAVFFACAMSGLVLVPLNWRLTAPELAYQLGDAQPAMLLVDPELRELGTQARDLAAPGAAVGTMASLAGPPPLVPAQTRPAGVQAAAAVTGDDPLLILYTSGTTGRPKGAVLTHANCFWTNLSLDRTAEMNGSDVVLQVLPQCHVGGWNVQPLLAWWKGATVVLEQSFDAARVLTLIKRKKITTMMGVPTNYLMLAEQPGFAEADLSSLRQVIVGGAPMPRPVLETWLARGVTVLQGYGLTEAAPNVLCVPAEYATEKTGSAGRPYLHVRVALRDLNGSSLVEGTGTGELLVAGPNVFASYWRNPQATKAALDGGWLATGDIAERDADGFYWIRGRSKDMYISGGENVYPAEVEEALIGHESVAEAAVVGVPDQRWGETGLAFVVLRPGRDASAEELTAYCRTRLARYKVPAHFRVTAELPKLTSGKLDKVTLRSALADLTLRRQRMSTDLSGRKVLVTGGASGIGAACAVAFAAAGATVTVADLDAQGARKVAEPLGGIAVGVDLADPSFDAAALAADMDVIVNNAGIQHVSPVEDFPEEKFRLILALMLEAPFRLVRAALPHMYAGQWGRIVNISSVHGLRASAFKSAYVAAKHGLEGLSKTIALEGGPRGVTSNTICPAYVRTPLVEKQVADQARIHGIPESDVIEKIMLTEPAVKRLIEPAEVAELAVFLCSPPMSFANGSSFSLDGGWSAR